MLEKLSTRKFLSLMDFLLLSQKNLFNMGLTLNCRNILVKLVILAR